MDAILLPATLAIKLPGHSKLDSLEAKGTHLADISARNATLKGTNNRQTSVMGERDISLNDNLGKLAKEAQQWPQKKQKQDWKLNNY